ncbi:MAG TPA: sec-independent translocase [Mycobacteriales bacterium]|nr:sec-independent translocase [Mycobacteriales bacterium]
MFGNLGIDKLLVLLVVALVVLGPERLPKLAADAGRLLRRLRELAQSASSELKEELGPEFTNLNLADLHPRRFVEKHLFGDDEVVAQSPVSEVAGSGPAPPRPLDLGPGDRPPFDPDAT